MLGYVVVGAVANLGIRYLDLASVRYHEWATTTPYDILLLIQHEADRTVPVASMVATICWALLLLFAALYPDPGGVQGSAWQDGRVMAVLVGFLSAHAATGRYLRDDRLRTIKSLAGMLFSVHLSRGSDGE